MDFLFRIAILVLGYLYPAYKCFKDLDVSKPKFEQLHVWCQYWIILAVFAGFEGVADIFISWLPFYSGAKLAFIVYLWHPETKGTEYIYETLIKPCLSKHTDSVDVKLALLRGETASALAVLWNRLLYYVEVRLSGILHRNAVRPPNVASQCVQDNLKGYPSISSSFSKSQVQQSQKQWPFSGLQPLVTQSTIWPHEQQRPQRQGWSIPGTPLDGLFGSPAVQPTQLSKRQTWPLQQPAAKPNHTSAMLSSTTESRNLEGKDEADFELVHSNEVPVPEASGSAIKGKNSAQGARSRWWWRW